MFNHADREVSGSLRRIVAQSPDGSVTLLSPQGWVTGRPVSPEATSPKGFVASIFRR